MLAQSVPLAPPPGTNEAISFIDRHGPLVGGIFIGSVALIWFLKVDLIPWLKKRAELRDQQAAKRDDAILAEMQRSGDRADVVLTALPAAMDRLITAHENRANRTDDKIDALPDKIEQRFVNVMRGEARK